MHGSEGEQTGAEPRMQLGTPDEVWAGGMPIGRTVELCRRCVTLLPVDGAAVTVRGSLVTKELLHATDPVVARLDDIQFVVGEGPCRDAYRLRIPVLQPDLTAPDVARRWPLFTREALGLGVAAVFAFPLQIGAVPFGVLELYRATPGVLAPEELATALLLADAAAHSVMDDFTRSELFAGPGEDERGIGEIEVPRATGMVAARHGISVHAALAELRAAAFAQDRPLIDIAREVLAGASLRED
ncbi:GAF domain-containing protein [Nakamurella flavida]